MPPDDARVEVEVGLLRTLYDMIVGSLDWSSGLFYEDEMLKVQHVGLLIGVDQAPPSNPTPHLWHQDCSLPWRCGQSAGAEIHQLPT